MLKAEEISKISLEEKIEVLREKIGKRVEKILDKAIALAVAKCKKEVSACIGEPGYLEFEDIESFIRLHGYEKIELKFDRAEDCGSWIDVKFKFPE